MSEIHDILALHAKACKSDKKLAFATVIKTEGPSYRSAGARSLVVEDGTFGGGLSAGCLEGDIACRLDSSNRETFVVTYDLSEADEIRGFPFGCGGTIEIFVEPLPDQRALNAMRWMSELDEPAVMLTVVRSNAIDKSQNALASHITLNPQIALGSPIALGARFGVSQSGLKCFCDGLPNMLSTCEEIFRGQKSKIVRIKINDEFLDIFAEYFEPVISMVIFGDGEDARILEDMSRQIGLSVFRISKFDVRSHTKLLDAYPVLIRSYAVVMTHDLNLDTKVLEQLIVNIPPYIGVMGPRSRTQKILTEIGADPSVIFNQPNFYSPVGLNMAAETPAEIALSIIAEIQTVSRKTHPQHLRDKDGAIHERWTMESREEPVHQEIQRATKNSTCHH